MADALAVFECEREKALEAGDHTILIGRVLRFSARQQPASGLFHGRYSALAKASRPKASAAAGHGRPLIPRAAWGMAGMRSLDIHVAVP